MAEIVNICGKDYTIFSEDQYLRILEETCGKDVVERHCRIGDEYILYAEFEKNPLNYCSGECDAIFEVMENHQSDLDEIYESVKSIYDDYAAMQRPPKNIDKVRELLSMVRKMRNNF